MACPVDRIPQRNPLSRPSHEPPRDRYDVANRPIGDLTLRTRPTLRDLENFFCLLASIDAEIPIEEDFLLSCKRSLANMLSEAKTAYRGRHPKDVEVVGVDRPMDLYEALNHLRAQAEDQFDMPRSCTPYRPASHFNKR